MLKKKSLRDQLKEEMGTTVVDNLDMAEKLKSYESQVVLTGDVIAMLQNLLSYMLERDLNVLVQIAPDKQSLGETLSLVQKEMLKMMKSVGLEIPTGSKKVTGSELDRSWERNR